MKKLPASNALALSSFLFSILVLLLFSVLYPSTLSADTDEKYTETDKGDVVLAVAGVIQDIHTDRPLGGIEVSLGYLESGPRLDDDVSETATGTFLLYTSASSATVMPLIYNKEEVVVYIRCGGDDLLPICRPRTWPIRSFKEGIKNHWKHKLSMALRAENPQNRPAKIHTKAATELIAGIFETTALLVHEGVFDHKRAQATIKYRVREVLNRHNGRSEIDKKEILEKAELMARAGSVAQLLNRPKYAKFVFGHELSPQHHSYSVGRKPVTNPRGIRTHSVAPK